MASDREIQQAATPGPWARTPGSGYSVHVGPDGAPIATVWVTDRPNSDNDAEFVARFDPERVGRLLDVLDAARRHRCESGTLGASPCAICDTIDAYDAQGDNDA